MYFFCFKRKKKNNYQTSSKVTKISFIGLFPIKDFIFIIIIIFVCIMKSFLNIFILLIIVQKHLKSFFFFEKNLISK